MGASQYFFTTKDRKVFSQSPQRIIAHSLAFPLYSLWLNSKNAPSPILKSKK